MRYTLSLLTAAFCSATFLPASAQIKAYDYATPSYVQFSSPRYEVSETETNAVVTIVRTGDYRNLAAVEYSTREGTATDSVDFQACGGKVVFSAGQSVRTISIPILRGADSVAKTFQVELTEIDPSAVVVTPSAEVEIKPQPPTLTIGMNGGVLQISWPDSASKFALETQLNGEWVGVEGAVLKDTTWSSDINPTGPLGLFRLRAADPSGQ